MAKYIDISFATNGDKTDTPINAQPLGDLSYDQGWTSLYEENVVTDPNTAKSLSRTKMNGLFNDITGNIKQWQDQCYPDYYQFDNLGNPVEYKIYSAVRYNNGVYLSKINNNTSLPTNTTNWALFQTLDFASQAEAIARTATDKWMNPFVTGKLIDNELIGQTPVNAIDLDTTDLNTLSSASDAGIYYQNSNAKTPNNHYPVLYAGNLVVSVSAGGVSHTYTVYGGTIGIANRIYTRGYYLGAWSAWRDNSGGTDTLNPVGSILIVASNNVPAGYFLTTGTAISRTTYSALFAQIGTIYGAGDGSTTFNLPPFDTDGAFLRGSGVNAAALGVLQGDAIRNITGRVQARGLFGSTASASGALAIDSYTNNDSQPGSGVITINAFRLDASLQVPTAVENRPLNYSIKICIKF